VLEDVDYAGADFSPDGKDLAVSHVADGQSRVEFPIGRILVAKNASSPRVSRDGRLVSFWEVVSDTSTAVSIIGRDGKGKRALSAGWINTQGIPCWSADGHEVWFTANEHPGKPPGLWAVDLSGKRRLVMRVPESIELDDIAKDGRALVGYATIAQSVRFASASDPVEREVSWLDGSNVADLSPDGRTVLLNEVGEGAGAWPVVYVRSTDGSPAVKLGEGWAWSLSPDGNWVLAWNPPSGEKPSSLSLLPTGPGQSTELARGDLSDFSWGSFLPDGHSIVFAARGKEGPLRLFVQAVPGGQPRAIGPERLLLNEWTNPVSPDGKYVVAIRRGEVHLVSLDGAGTERVLPGLSTPDDRVQQWSRDSRYLYTYRRGERPQKVWLYDIATGQRHLWKEFPYDNSIEGIRLRMTTGGDAWTIEGRQVLGQLYVVEGLR
jgi:dipeptidyl aminopeptidase/acylaminoacyl peptidase